MKRLPLVLGLGLLFGSAVAQEPTDEEWAEAFAPYDIAMARGNLQGAANALTEIVSDEERSGFHGDALLNLGEVLVQLDLPYAGLLTYGELLASETPSATAVTRAILLTEDAPDRGLLQGIFGDNVGIEVEPADQASVAWLAALDNFRDGNLSVSLGILAMVDSSSTLYSKAQHLKGIIMAQQGRYTDSLAPLMTARSTTEIQDEVDLININLGRSYYGAENFARAIEYFALVERGSHHWLEAQFERAWAHFMLEDVSGAVALLLTHMSPFFDDQFFPEAELLDTYSLFLLCKFPAATERIEHFRDSYRPLLDELTTSLEGISNEELFEQARALLTGGESSVPARAIRDLILVERFEDILNVVIQGEEEIEKLRSATGGPFATRAIDAIEARISELRDAEGARLHDTLAARAEGLNTMLADTEIARLDILRLETRLYEQAASMGEMEEARRLAARQLRTPRGHVRWPFQGEFWADELGYYRVTAKPECPASLQVGTDSD